MTIQKTLKSVIILSSLLMLFTACKTTSKTTEGAVIGGTVGGVAGGVIGDKAGNTALGVIIGAAVGGTAGALIGNYMDKQAEEIEDDIEGAEVERVGEGILITFDSGLLFDFDSYQLKPATVENLKELAQTLKKYEDTNILIEGHTDNKGTDSYNQNLSEERAESVSHFLARQGVRSSRFSVIGYGEGQPVASNESEAGRQKNRRVEVAIFANEELKEAAENGNVKVQ